VPLTAIQPCIIEPIFEQFRALLPDREVDHPLGCHRPRIPDCVVFEKVVQVLVFGCAYWRIADGSCSATTLRRRRDEWIEAGVMDALEEIAREAYDRAIGLDLSDVAVDCCITKAPCGGEKAGRPPWIAASKVSSARRWWTLKVSLSERWLPQRTAMTHRCWLLPWMPYQLWEGCPSR
jgi:hypothetical protein